MHFSLNSRSLVKPKIQCLSQLRVSWAEGSISTALQLLLPELENGFIYDAVLFSSKMLPLLQDLKGQ